MSGFKGDCSNCFYQYLGGTLKPCVICEFGSGWKPKEEKMLTKKKSCENCYYQNIDGCWPPCKDCNQEDKLIQTEKYWRREGSFLEVEEGTWPWAVAVMVSGAKVRHKSWEGGLYYYMFVDQTGSISRLVLLDQDGDRVAMSAFYFMGWELCEEPKKEPPN